MRLRMLATALLTVSLPVISLAAQQRAPAPAPFKGVWEPVSYSEDIRLREVFFVTADKGWVAGDKGTILHTTDGGTTWTAQMGGDPEASEGDVSHLRFVDETHGWAVKDNRILRTEDGESWEDLGAAPQYLHELAMSSPTDGVAAGFLGMGSVPSTLLKTRDGGRTWQPVVECSIKAMIGGLNREIPCNVWRIQFVTPSVGYLVAKTKCVGPCEFPSILARTDDGGDSWRFFVGPGDPDAVGATDLFFTDENTGIVRTTDGKLSRTTDGGATWKGLLASVSVYSRLIFADPEVGWALEFHEKMSFTVDGGNRWNSRPFRFPATPGAWSFPRRDRAYVVGDHGMVYRYRVVPTAERVVAAAMPAPIMPGFESPLDEQVPELEGFVQDLTVAVDQAPASPASGTSTPFASSCCGDKVNRFDAVLSLVLQSLPQFVSRFKNTNLLTTGLMMLSTMPTQLGDVSGAYNEFKQAPSKEGAQAALARLVTALSSLRQSTMAAFQREAAP